MAKGALIAGMDFSNVDAPSSTIGTIPSTSLGASECLDCGPFSGGLARRTSDSRLRPMISRALRCCEPRLPHDRGREPVAVVEARDREGGARAAL
jgi:hypothetical protein